MQHIFTSVLVSLCCLTSTLSPALTSLCFATSTLYPPVCSPSSTLLPCSALRGYLVAAPSVFRAGVEESVSVTIFNAKAETRVQVQLSVKGQTVAHGHGSVLGENES